MGELNSEELDRRIGSNSILNNLSCIELNDEEDVKAFETEDVNGEEVCGKERVPMSGEESFPRQGGFDITGFTEVREYTSDRFV